MTPEETRHFWLMMRQAWLMMVDAVERYILKMEPRTSELRKERKQQ